MEIEITPTEQERIAIQVLTEEVEAMQDLKEYANDRYYSEFMKAAYFIIEHFGGRKDADK